MKAIIIEDEPVAAQALESLLGHEFPDIAIVAVLQSIEESVDWFHSAPMPDLLFMDIHLADGSSFAIFNEVDITCPVIFTTAYDEYALRAFEVNGIDYLLKPIDRERLARAVEKALRMIGNPSDPGMQIGRLMEEIRRGQRQYKSFLLIPDRDKLIPIPVNDIAYVWNDLKIVRAMTYNGKSYVLEYTLAQLADMLDPAVFYRANRQFIVSRHAVRDVSLWFGSKLAVNLTVPVPEKIFISKAKVKEFKDWLTD